MKLYQIVLKDIMRRKRRVLYATLGVLIGTMTVIAILTVAQAGQARIYSQLEKYGANLTIVPATRSLNTGLGDLTLGTVTVGENYIPEDKLPEIRRIADGKIKEALKIKDDGEIAAIAPKLYLTGDIKGTSVMLVGFNPDKERSIKTWWEIQSGKFLDGADQLLVGSRAAELLKLNIGDAVPVNGSDLAVTGILGETGSNEDYQIFVPLATLQALFNKQGLISSVDVRALCNACPVEIIADAINGEIPGVRAVAVKQVAATEMGMVEKINNFMLAIAGITLLVGGFGVVNTLMTSIHERTKDIGIMRAVGASRNQIIKALIYEATVLGVAGGVLGYLAGTALAYIVGPLIFEGTQVSIVLTYLPLSLLLAIFIATLATLYPAFHAARIRVADAFRSL
ncbi:MAG: ABC transporter permease [Dehalococcoidales bacterium]|nr:ABC transporter permease [Dehalococcoidales bacterium]